MRTYEQQTVVEAVASSVTARVQRLAHAVGWDIPSPALIAGQMLRTRLAGRIAQRRAPLDRADLVSLCAATELLHLANLCHDNVADNPRASQRPRPVWLTRGASTAVLLGDLLLVDATQIVVATRGGRHVKSFLDKAKEVLESEVQQEVHGPAMAADLAHCQRRARGKSGPLFAFTAALGGADEPPLARALEEAGYQIGTACQLADDFLDPTRQDRSDVRREAQERVAALCAAALEALTPWPGVQTGLAKFLVHDLAPARAPEATPRPAPVQTPA